MIEELDPLIPYMLWKISTNSVRQKEQQLLCFHNINYDLKDEKWNIDDFLEIKDKTKTELYLFYITFLIQNDLVSEVRIRILDDNNPYKTESNLNSNDFLNLYLDIHIDKEFLKKNSNIFPDFQWLNQSTKEKEYSKFIGGFYSTKEALQINNLEVWKLKENFHIYFFYKPNLEKISLYIQEYLLEWWNEKLTPTDNYIKPSMQIQYFRSYVIEHINNYGDEFIYNIWTNSKLDEITLILYYNITWYIELLKFDEWVDRINWFQHKNINFKIKILERFFDDFIDISNNKSNLENSNTDEVEKNFVLRINENILNEIQDKATLWEYSQLFIEACKKLPAESEKYSWFDKSTWLKRYKPLQLITENDYDKTIKLLKILKSLNIDIKDFDIFKEIDSCYENTLNFDWVDLRENINQSKEVNKANQNRVELLNDLYYYPSEKTFKNTRNNTKYITWEKQWYFMLKLIEQEDFVKYEDLIKILNEDISDWTFKWNLLKLLRSNNVLWWEEDFIEAKRKSYRLKIYS